MPKKKEINRGMVKLIHADNFYQEGGCEELWNIANSLRFVPKDYGKEIEHFNLFQPGLEPMFSKIIGESVDIDEDKSGVFRIPFPSIVHFEAFDDINEWCFAVALEDNVMFNLYQHESGASTALDGYQFNYRNMFEWNYYCNFQLKQNQGIFYRPWLFHSFSSGMIQYFKLFRSKTK
jgi:hypothetical protein